MALPVLIKTFQYDVNQFFANSGVVLTDCRALLLAIKNSFLGFALSPWTVDYSCNSVVAGVPGDAVDHWAAGADLVWDFGGNPHSWIVLTQPGLSNAQILISCSSNNPQVLTVAFSLSGGFVGGNTTTDPTAPDQVTILNNSGWLNSSGVSQDQIAHVQQSTDGQCTRVVICNGGNAIGFWLFDLATNTVTGWTTPVVTYANGSGGATDITTYTNLFNSAALRGYQGASMPLYMTSEAANNQAIGVNQASANDLDGAWPMAPIGLYCTQVGLRGRNGSLFDVWYGSTAIITGDTYPAGVSRQFAQFGQIILPWNGSVVQVS